jgi:hypothetical protein
MGFQLEFVEGYPEVTPDPVRAHVQFSVKWKCINTGDEPSPSVQVVAEVSDANGPLLTSFGRNVMPLNPGDQDGDIIAVGAVGAGSGTLTVTIDGPDGEQTVIPLVVT